MIQTSLIRADIDHPPAPYEVDSFETGIPRELCDRLANL